MIALLTSALMLGALVLLAGCYGTLYCISRMNHRANIRLAGYACYLLQCAVTSAIIVIAPLLAPWKFLILVCTLGSLGVPPLTWRVVALTHQPSRGPA